MRRRENWARRRAVPSRRPSLLMLALFGTSAVLLPASGGAQTTQAGAPKVRYAVDLSVTGAAILGAGLASLVSVDSAQLWRSEMLWLDRGLRGRSSVTAARLSDVLATVDVIMPLGLLLGPSGMDEVYGKRALVYAETVVVSLCLNGMTKYLVARPRPYVYSDAPQVQSYAQREGKDSRLSFYSGHASTTFAAGVAGSILFAQTTSDRRARTAVWAFELALAGATTDLRLRAGKHFYSDVLVGAVVGATLGVLVPRLHGGPGVEVSPYEWVAIASAPMVGATVAQLLPIPSDTSVPLDALVLPWVTSTGGGLLATRAF
jgi:membrane-associated phospholipid phosphatase